ncbi:MAG: carboxypeptidase regulatory-like domain-containing protein [Candidatus Nanosalina sp.]
MYSCENGPKNFYLGDVKVELGEKNSKITHGDLTVSGNFDSIGLGTREAVLECSGKNYTREVEVKNLSLEAADAHKGKTYFGRAASWNNGEFVRPVTELVLELESKSGDLNADGLELASETAHTSIISYEESTESLEIGTTSEYVPPQGDNTRLIDVTVDYNSLKTEFSVPLKVYPWRPSFVGDDNPGRKIQYENLGELSYKFDLASAGSFMSPENLQEENFRVTVDKLGDDSNIYTNGGVEYKEKKWISTSEPSNADYKLKLSNIPELETGKYKFKTEIVVESGKSDGKAPIDSVRVVKTRQFSGQVRDSSGRGVRTEMILKNNARTIPVNAGSDGLYSTEISTNRFNAVNLRFFDRGKSSPDATFSLTGGVDLGKDSSVGGSEAIKFDYWENAPVDVSGVRPVNMMAVKFGYNINGGASTSMAFNPANINPRKLQVFECTSWNFLGKSCLGDWQKVPKNDISINYANWRVNIGDLGLHHISEETGGTPKDILMNAYLVGTNARLGLKGKESPLTVNSGSIVSGGDLEVSGTVVSSEGNPVEGANVTLELLNKSKVVKSFKTSSSADGSFTVKGNVPVKAGSYRLRVRIQEEPFKPFSTVSDSRIQVYYEKGIELEKPDSPDIRLGEETSMSFGIRNTGQVPVKDLQFSLSGLQDKFYELKSAPDSLSPEEGGEVVYSFSFPENFCPYPCSQPPNFNVQVSGTAKDSEVKSMISVFTNIVRDSIQENRSQESRNSTPETESTSASRNSSETSLVSDVAESVVGPTGAFLRRQSSLNIALGLIMLFSMVLAAAVKKKKNGGDRRQRYGGRGSYGGSSGSPRTGDFGANIVSPDDDLEEDDPELEQVIEGEGDVDQEGEMDQEKTEDVDSGDEDNQKESQSEEEVSESSDSGDDEKYVCEETGEEFDTEAALRMHKKINGIE